MTDKDVERNVRSTTVEGIKTPTERYVHDLGEQHAASHGEKVAAKKMKESLLDKFRRRELKKAGRPEKGEREELEPGVEAGGENPPE